jgi:MinD-like ATPase involved in chromosome partitioning or flagellar assembly
MARIISIHSFRGGTGKSNTAANIAALLASQGLKVGVVDSDIQSPGIHILFGIRGEDVKYSLNDYLWGNCAIEETAHDVTSNLGAEVSGQVLLIPSSMDTGNIARVLHEGYDVGVMSQGLRELSAKLELDVLLIDTHPGLNEETLLSIALSDVLVIILRPDEQDYEGTAVTISVARRLQVPRMYLILNKVPQVYDIEQVKEQVVQTYETEIAAVIPHSDEMMTLASRGIFAMHFPNHPITKLFREVADQLTAS